MVPELEVTNIEKSLEFYLNILGFEIKYDRPEEGFAFLTYKRSLHEVSELMLDQIGAGRSWVELGDEKPLGRGVSFEIDTNELDELVERLAKAGVKLHAPLETKTYRIGQSSQTQRQIWLRDPDGYLLRFSQTEPN